MHIAQDQAFSRDELYRIYEDYQQQQASKKLLEHISRRCPGCNLPVTLDDASNRCSYVCTLAFDRCLEMLKSDS